MDAKTLCLGVLVLGDASGYEIRKQFEDGPFAYFHETSFGSIYPALTKLTAEGLVTCTDVAQAGRPDKKVYAITDAGRAVFRQALRKTPAKDRIRSESLYMFFFADMLDSAQLTTVFDDYLDYYRGQVTRLEAMEEALRDPARAEDIIGEALGDAAAATMATCLPAADEKHRRFTRGFGLNLYRTIVAYMEENRGLLIDGDAETPRPRRVGGAS